MSKNISEQPSADGARPPDEAGLAQMVRYELTRSRSARDLLLSCGGTTSKPTIDRRIDDPWLLPDKSIASAGVRVGEKIRSLVRLVIAGCRWSYERVAL
jgi:hypothetical protein